VRDDGFRARGGNALDNLFRCRRPRSETRLDRPDIDAPAQPHKLLARFEAFKRLVDRRPVSEMQQFLGADQSAFGKALRMVQNLLGNGRHGSLLCQKYIVVSDNTQDLSNLPSKFSTLVD